MRLISCFLYLLASLWLALPEPALAQRGGGPERKIALVIGNAKYDYTSELPNAKKDALAMATTLEKLGFDVVIKLEEKHDEVLKAIEAFRQRASHGVQVALLYFAGHGLEFNGRNHMLLKDSAMGAASPSYPAPAAQSPTSPSSLVLRTIEMERVATWLHQAHSGLTIVFFDACRNDLQASRGPNLQEQVAPFSLQEQAAPPLLILPPAEKGDRVVVYSTSAGFKSSDGYGHHSPFTDSLLRNIATPGLPLDKLLEIVAADVAKATSMPGPAQKPWVDRSTKAAFNFSFSPSLSASIPQDDAAKRCDVIYRNAIMSTDKVNTYKEFLNQCPNHPQVAEVDKSWRREVEARECKRLEKGGPDVGIVDMDTHLHTYNGPDALCTELAKTLRSHYIAKAAPLAPLPNVSPPVVRAPPRLDVQPPIQALPSASKPIFEPAGEFTHKPKTYVEGRGYSTWTRATAAWCQSQCAADARCSMWEFHPPESSCNHFAHTSVSGSTKDNTHVGIKRSALATDSSKTQPSAYVPPAASFRKCEKCWVYGTGYREFKSTVSQCETTCAGEKACKTYEFDWKRNVCGLFGSVMVKRETEGASTVGWK